MLNVAYRRGAFACLALLTGALTSGCQNPPPPATAPPAEVTVSKPLTRTITDAYEYTGRTQALESVEVRPRVSGFLEKVHFEPRAKVDKGAVLFSIDARPFQNTLDTVKSRLEQAQGVYATAEFNLRNTSDIYKSGAATEREMVEAQSRFDEAKAAVSAAKANIQQAELDLEWCGVVAPIRGRVSRTLVDAGNVVAADATILTTIVNDEQVFVYFNASERDILELRERARTDRAAAGVAEGTQPELRDMKFPLFLSLMTEEGFPHEGVLDYAAPTVDAATGTLQVRGAFPNQNGLLLAGLFCRVRFPIGKPYEALTVTERALGSDQGQRYLLVVNEKDVVEYRPVKVGTLQEGMRVITAGITASDRVIVSGIQRARPGLTVKPVEAPMPVGPVAQPERKAPATKAAEEKSGQH
jgi:RND family efflux transporter MFP subunit